MEHEPFRKEMQSIRTLSEDLKWILSERYIKFQKIIDINFKNVYNVEAKARGFL